ncbi:hypothetical protein ACFWYW_57545 [Nonomuraea sp. NPDC059023]|uniref:hypothetical protein n=1 Tax=unclassified Nonomuraea TaxID=2593643 RepID=UPI0036AD0D81
MSDKVVYRSTHPDVLAAWGFAARAREEWADQMKAFLDEHGLGKRTVWTYNVTGEVFGIEDNGDDIPDGWRVDSRTGHLMPKLATKRGKAISARLKELPQPDPRASMPGMPAECFVSLARLVCGLAELGGALYATWSREISESEVDASLWERVKLSEYYAAVEAHEAAQAVTVGGEVQ